MPSIVIINPNSTDAVTAGMDAAVEPLRVAGAPRLECVTLSEGPPGIETDEHIQAVVRPICDLVRARSAETSAFVIACYSDPGLREARALSEAPVFGIAESAMLTAMTQGEGFGVISILPESVPRHRRYVSALGLASRSVGDRPIGMGVTELTDEGRTMQRLVEVGRELRDRDGADVVILGCAGMARYRARLEDDLGVPVIDPTQAAAALAIGTVLLAAETGAAPGEEPVSVRKVTES